MRFPLITLSCLLILCAVILLSYQKLVVYETADIEAYQALMRTIDPKKPENQPAPYTAKQQHRHTHKDLWFVKAGQRLQLRLRSTDTDLVLDHQDDTTEVIEYMHGVTCCMQEELYYLLPDGKEVQRRPDGLFFTRHRNADDPTASIEINGAILRPMQVIRYMEADAATYYYQTDRFTAENVKMSRFIAPGHSLVELSKDLKPFMSGVARSVEFSLVGNDLNFTAYHMKANFTGRTR